MQHDSLINFSFENSLILDMFSGVGSFGLECISRGSKSVMFCENYPETIRILKKNIHDLNCEKKTEIIKENIFNIINLKLLKKRGIVVIHRHKSENEIYPKNLKILKIKTYGISKIIFGLIVQ